MRGRERTLRPEEIDLLKKTVAKGADDQEFMLFMTVCRKHRIDPFVKQIYCVIWPTNNNTSHEMVIITGINGYRMLAARDHKDFGGTSDGKFEMSTKTTPAGRKIPTTATVFAYRKGCEPASATVYWEEFAPADLTAKRSDFWNRMPKHMLAKCAESHALRKAFPDLSDIYTEEEMSQKFQDLTPEGRQISTDGVAPSGSIVDRHDYAKAQQGEIVQAKSNGTWCEKHHCHTSRCPAHEHSAIELAGHANSEAAEKRQAKAVNPEVMSAKDALPAGARDVTPKSSGKPEAKPEAKKASGGDSGAKRKIPPGSQIVRGNLTRSVAGSAKTGAQTRDVKIGNAWYKSFRTTLFPHFDMYGHSAGGFVAEVYVDKNHCVIGIIRIGPQNFEEDGATPTNVKVEREPGWAG